MFSRQQKGFQSCCWDHRTVARCVSGQDQKETVLCVCPSYPVVSKTLCSLKIRVGEGQKPMKEMASQNQAKPGTGVHTHWPSMGGAVTVSWVLKEPGLKARHWQREIAERGGEEGGEDKESKPKKEEAREEGKIRSRFIKFSRPTWIYDPPDSASWLTEFIGMCHYSWLLWWFFLKIYFLDLIFCISSSSPFFLPSLPPPHDDGLYPGTVSQLSSWSCFPQYLLQGDSSKTLFLTTLTF